MLRQATNNPDVVRGADAKIREAERSLSYFEDTLRQLQSRKMMQAQQDDPSRSGSPAPAQAGGSYSQRAGRQSDSNRVPQSPAPDGSRRSAHSPQSPDMRASTGSLPNDDAYGVPKPKTYTKLDLIKADTPHTTAKISRMLHELEFKLQVEIQLKKGIDKMAKLFQADGDRRSRADAEAKKIESERKIQLLQTALKRYKTLHILDDAEEDDDPGVPGVVGPGGEGERNNNLRSKNLSGKLLVTLKGARELEHAPTASRSRSASKQIETYVSFKVEGTERARSHPTRTDRWMEDFEIIIEKTNEVEITVYDKSVGELHPVPIGLLWIKISDLVDAQRKQKVMMENGQGGWVTAGAMSGDSSTISAHGQPGATGDMNAPIGLSDNRVVQPSSSAPSTGQTEGIDAWFAVEPAGAIALQLNFVKENVRKRPLDAPGGLGRQGAVRKRKDEVHEMNGHKFVQRQFYQIILCAFCNEFLLNAVGYQCEDCRYTCHKKCYEKVVTKCISKSNTGDDDAEKINHRIPHRFEPITNIGANWCCHCGYMLPLGRKNARKCTECGITCHANCAHLVPDFCGMSMETANILLRDWRDINKARGGKPTQARRTTQPSKAPMLPELHADHVADDMGQLKLAESPLPQKEAAYTRQQMHSPPPEAMPPDHRVPPSAQAAYPGQAQRLPPGAMPTGVTHEEPASPQAHSEPAPVYAQQTPIAASQQLPQAPAQPYRQPTRKRKVGLDDFNFLAVLGKGNFGKVMLAEEKKSSSLYAIKVLKKEFIIDNDEVESTRSEKRVFLAAARERHPFLLGLHSCFQTETRVYFVMEYVSGGDLMLHIQRKQFSLRQAKFYASEVLLALEYFHANGIIYRDLKLDNILLTLDGHVKVADYGLCKEDMWFGSTTSTFCGTPEFMAPEILLEQRYGRAVDWWAFGVLMYEMLLGQSPFRGDDEDEIFDATLEDEPLYPITMPRDAVSILQKLLTRDPARRLGSGKGDAEEIKRHPFFKDVNFDDVMNKRIPPPYFPTVNGTADTSNFDEEFTREQPTLTPVHTQLSSRDQAEFNGFSWVASWADV
ncbi:protein kinase C [Laetiporus sulphureus 93-53]|uniref:protein kinase C n=1 Tax=Laetiporus sulphureus 93-53 TaxID=1314785 RepID=A0A165HNZ7_9APHY|nr:protein kinase C [Laetiporus sulphureus 93-53]KZT11990.1 protein kinase C [Laetiporus sulphureus 93-53]